MTQKELKAHYENVLRRDVWPKDEEMINYCVKKAAHIVLFESGDFIVIEKPSIKKDFCFGYSDSHTDTEDYDRANRMANHASKSEDYFIAANLRDITEKIERLKTNENNSRTYCTGIAYYKQPESSPLKALVMVDKYIDDMSQLTQLTGEDLAKVIAGYEVVKAQFEKRLASYLKRYGLSKVKSWSYWRDA